MLRVVCATPQGSYYNGCCLNYTDSKKIMSNKHYNANCTYCCSKVSIQALTDYYNKWSKHRRRRRTVQSHSPGGANVLPMWAHWCHLANTIELMLPSAHPSPQSKQHIDLLSHSCTAHSRKLYTYNGLFFPLKLSLPMGVSGPHLIHGFPRPPESSTQMESRSVKPFL